MSQLHTKALGGPVVKASGQPDAAQLAAIRGWTLRDFAAEELVVREFALAHNAIDRDHEVFGPDILADFAATLPGKGVFIRHPSTWDGDSGPGEGKVFAARLERMSHDAARTLLREPGLQFPPDHAEAVVLMANAYYVRTPDNESFLLKLDAGIAGEVSIGFRGGDIERVKGQDGIELNVWRWKGPSQAVEMSHVWLGAQPGARATKHTTRNAPPKETAMDATEIKALREEAAQLKTQLEAATKASTALDALRKALGDDSNLLDADGYDGLIGLVSAGKSYRKSLIDDIVVAERHAGITGDSDAETKAATELYASLPTEKLEAVHKRFANTTGRPGIAGGDPNTGAPGTGASKAADGTPAANPMFA